MKNKFKELAGYDPDNLVIMEDNWIWSKGGNSNPYTDNEVWSEQLKEFKSKEDAQKFLDEYKEMYILDSI